MLMTFLYSSKISTYIFHWSAECDFSISISHRRFYITTLYTNTTYLSSPLSQYGVIAFLNTIFNNIPAPDSEIYLYTSRRLVIIKHSIASAQDDLLFLLRHRRAYMGNNYAIRGRRYLHYRFTLHFGLDFSRRRPFTHTNGR